MKYFFTTLIILLLPLSLFAMTPLADSELDEVSGQSGVCILPNITMDIHFDVIAWGDADGIGGSSSGGYVGLTNMSLQGLSIGLRTDDYSDIFPSRNIVINGFAVKVYDTGTTLEALRHPFKLD